VVQIIELCARTPLDAAQDHPLPFRFFLVPYFELFTQLAAKHSFNAKVITSPHLTTITTHHITSQCSASVTHSTSFLFSLSLL
jgi:hypothetical protein